MHNLIALVLVIPAVMFNGWVVSMLWSWYLVPLLNAPHIGMAGGIGVALIARVLTYQRSAETENPRNLLENMIYAMTYTLVALTLGFAYINIWPV